MQAPAASVIELASAFAAAATSQTLSPAQAQSLQRTGLEDACSLRIAFVLPGTTPELVLVSGDLRVASVPQTYWVTPAARSIVGATLRGGRTTVVEAEEVHHFVDLLHLGSSEGATSFLCLPITANAELLTARPAAAALLLSYASAAPQEELRLALLLAGHLSQLHGAELKEHGEQLGQIVNPAAHTPWGPGVDDAYPELSSSGSGSSDHGSGSSTGGDERGQPSNSSTGRVITAQLRRRQRRASRLTERGNAPVAGWGSRAFSLRFVDRHLEQRFQQWHNSRMAQVDAMALLSLLVYHSTSCLLPPFTSCRPSWLSSSLVPAVTVLIPLLLLLVSSSKQWYSRHRDQLMVVTYLLLTAHQAFDLSAQLREAPHGVWRAVVLRVDVLWCLVLGVILQAQLVSQVSMIAASLVLKAVLQPGCADWLVTASCSAAAPATSGCSVGNVARLLLLKMVVPCVLAYYVELSSRRTFCRTLALGAVRL